VTSDRSSVTNVARTQQIAAFNLGHIDHLGRYVKDYADSAHNVGVALSSPRLDVKGGSLDEICIKVHF